MSASQGEGIAGRFKGLKLIAVDLIDPNPENPRLEFPPEELARLSESISKEGILVPVVAYETDDGRYTLVDGERRYKCARELGLDEVPAVVTSTTDRQEILLQMFNIHLVREEWKDMPTAYALGRVIDEIGVTTGTGLSDMTGLSVERIRRLRHALELPKEYQRYISEGTIPLNWFWELRQNVIEPMAKHRRRVFDEYGKDRIYGAFVGKRLRGLIPDTVSLRNVRPIITLAAQDAGSADGASFLDDTIRSLVTDDELTIEQAYEDAVQIMVEADKLERNTSNMVRSFHRLLGRVRTAEERERVVGIGKHLVETLRKLLS